MNVRGILVVSTALLPVSVHRQTVWTNPDVGVTAGDWFDDLDVGQTVANTGETASGNGTLAIDNVQTIDVTDDVDIGETSGTATADGTGILTIHR